MLGWVAGSNLPCGEERVADKVGDEAAVKPGEGSTEEKNLNVAADPR